MSKVPAKLDSIDNKRFSRIDDSRISLLDNNKHDAVMGSPVKLNVIIEESTGDTTNNSSGGGSGLPLIEVHSASTGRNGDLEEDSFGNSGARTNPSLPSDLKI